MIRRLALLVLSLMLVTFVIIQSKTLAYYSHQTIEQTRKASAVCPLVHLVVLIDHSGSMNQRCDSRQRNDPYDMRLWVTREALAFLTHTTSTWDDAAEVQVDVFLFGSQVMPLTSFHLSSQTRPQDIEQKLDLLRPDRGKIPETLCNTNFVDPLQSAVDRLTTFFPSQGQDCPHRIVLLVTDGKPYLDPEEDPAGRFYYKGHFVVSAHMESVQKYWEQFGRNAQLFLVVLDPAQRIWDHMRSWWEPIADASFVVQEPSGMARDMFEVLQQILQRIPLRQQVQIVPVCGVAEVPPFTREVTFLYWKDEAHHYITVTDPQGQVVVDNGQVLGQAHQINYTSVSPVIERVTIPNPQPGTWIVKGQGKCQIHMVRYAYQLQVSKPSYEPLTAFQQTPLEIRATGIGGGLPTTVNSAQLQVSSFVQDPEGQKTPISLQEAAPLLYQGEFVPVEQGEYALYFWAEFDGSVILGSRQVPIKLFQVRMPQVKWIAQPLPHGQYSQFQEILWQFHLLNAQGQSMALAPGFTLDVHLQLHLPEGAQRGIPVAWDESSQSWKAELSLEQEGEYRWVYSIKVNTPTGQQVLLDEDQKVFYVSKSEPLKVVVSQDIFYTTDPLGRTPPYITVPLQVRNQKTNASVNIAHILPAGEQPFEADLFGPAQQLVASTEEGALRIQATENGYQVQIPTDKMVSSLSAYTLRIRPKQTVVLSQGYIWYQPPWDFVLRFAVHPAVVIVRIVAFLALVALLSCVIQRVRTRRPLVALYVHSTSTEDAEPVVWQVGYKAQYRQGWGLPFFWPYLPCPLPQRIQPLRLNGLRWVRLHQDAKGRIHIRYKTLNRKVRRATLRASGDVAILDTPIGPYRVEVERVGEGLGGYL